MASIYFQIPDKSETLNIIDKNTCLLNEECQFENIIYQNSLNSNKLECEEKYYKAKCETTLKNDSPIIKNHLARNNIKTKQNFERKYGILS